MEIPPKKPHFFKPILPGFKNGLKIPLGFLKYLKGHDQHEHAILTRGGKKWLVKANGRRLEEGSWKEFVEELNLKFGDVLVFKHEGDMEFDVFTFDSSHHCDKEYAMDEDEDEEDEDEDEDKHLSQSYFECTIRQYCLSRGFMCIPRQFAIKNRLNDRKCKIIVKYKQRSWTFDVYTNGQNTHIGSGWREFCITNCLKEGDHFIFEIISKGETPIFRIHDLSGSSSLQPEVKKKKSKAKRKLMPQVSVDANSHFISTIKPYTINNPVLYLPIDFVKSNGLMRRREMILIDEKRRSWSVWIGRTGHHFAIKRGWTQFRNANGIQVGDTYKFELTNNDTIPIVHFHCKYSGN